MKQDHQIQGDHIFFGYGDKSVLSDVSLSIDKPQIVSIIGPNGAGKSTILKAFARFLKPQRGSVWLDGKNIHQIPSKEVAKVMAVLPQNATAPMDISVRDLVACGRAPYQSYFTSMSKEDHQKIETAMVNAGVLDFIDRPLMSLSGGERQRVWLAMALAQDPEILLLDEPTTFLDIQHQLEMMQLVRRLHQELGITIIMVLHDLNHATRFSDRVIAIKRGEVFADGPVKEVMTEKNFEELYGVKAVRFDLVRDEEEYSVFIPHSVC